MANEIKTARLLLRPIMTEDLDELDRVWTDPEVRKYIWDGVAISREEAAALIDRFDKLLFEGVVGSTDTANARSTRVMERAEMNLIKLATVGGLDTVYYGISRSEFERGKRSRFDPASGTQI